MSQPMNDLKKYPKLVVFDLDYTLWPFWVDTHVDPPFKKDTDSKIRDSRGKVIKHYPDVPQMLKELKKHADIKLAIASRTSEINGAQSLVQLFQWDSYFEYSEIYPGSKVTHFNRFASLSKIPYCEMLFFDDEQRNIVEVGKLGVNCVHVPDGMSMKELNRGLKQFVQNS